jgi:hypothetical protein
MEEPMTKKNQTPEVAQPVLDDIMSADEAPEPRSQTLAMDTMMAIVQHTRGQSNLPIKTAIALTVLEDGAVPPSAIKVRPGYPGDIKYASHVWGTRTLNAAFRWLWDYEVLAWEVFEDGSVATSCKLTVHIPMDENSKRFYTRKIREVGAFEAYIKKDNNGHPIISAVTGKPDFTMSTADRVASSASRGLMKCMLRAFNIGTEFSEGEEELTPKLAWNLLLKFGKNQGLTRDEIIEVIKAKGIKSEELVDKYQQAYTAIYNKAKGQEQEEVPL